MNSGNHKNENCKDTSEILKSSLLDEHSEPKQAWTDCDSKPSDIITSPTHGQPETHKSTAHKQYYEEISGAKPKVRTDKVKVSEVKVKSDDEDSDSEESEEERKAPNELLMEVSVFINHSCDPTVVIWYLIWLCDMDIHIFVMLSYGN